MLPHFSVPKKKSLKKNSWKVDVSDKHLNPGDNRLFFKKSPVLSEFFFFFFLTPEYNFRFGWNLWIQTGLW